VTGIFVSYRRVPSTAWAGRIADRLRAHFGARLVFLDVANIRPGVDFPEEIEARIREVAALIAVIDPQWASAKDGLGLPRWNHDDWMRKEIAAALTRRVTVIPVLVDRAEMPSAEDLPSDIRDLASRNAIELSPLDFDSDVERLIIALEMHGVRKSLPKRIGVTRGLVMLIAAVALTILLALRMIDIARERRLRAEATGPLATLGGIAWERFEVTNTRYRACVDAGRCDKPGLSRLETAFDDPDRLEFPVVNVRADQAAGFCTWIGRRLPTRAEWESAATQEGRTSWPWGDEEPTPGRVNANFDHSAGYSPPDRLTQVKIRALSRKQHVMSETLATVAPHSPRGLLTDIARIWPQMSVGERNDRLNQLYDEYESSSYPDEGPDDVAPVTDNPSGATPGPSGVYHLVGNAAEWSSTTDTGEWDGRSPTALQIDGGSFRDDIDSLMTDDYFGKSDIPLDTIGFRCVTK